MKEMSCLNLYLVQICNNRQRWNKVNILIVGKAVVAMCFFMMYLLFIQYFPHDVKYGMAQKFSLFWNAISRTCSDLAYS